MRRLRRDHPGVRPAGRALLGHHRLDPGLAVTVDRVRDDLPGRADLGRARLERRDLLGVVRPIFADVGLLHGEQCDGRIELLLRERVRVLDAEGARVAVCGISSAAGEVSVSVTVTPVKPSCFRSKPLMIVLENAAGRFEPSSLG